MSRKGFLATAAAGVAVVGAAALIPSRAEAEPADEGAAEASKLGELVAEVEPGGASLEGTKWAEAASAAQDGIDVVKSKNGLHTMNAQAHWVFSGWQPEYDQATDVGFGMLGYGLEPRFYVSAATFEHVGERAVFDVGEVYMGRGRVAAHFVVERGTVTTPYGDIRWELYEYGGFEATGRLIATEKSSWVTGLGMYETSTSAPQFDFPFELKAPPLEFCTLHVSVERDLSANWCGVMTEAYIPATTTKSGVYYGTRGNDNVPAGYIVADYHIIGEKA